MWDVEGGRKGKGGRQVGGKGKSCTLSMGVPLVAPIDTAMTIDGYALYRHVTHGGGQHSLGVMICAQRFGPEKVLEEACIKQIACTSIQYTQLVKL